MAAELPPRPSAGAVEKAMLAHPGMSPDRGERILAAEVLHLRARIDALRTPPTGEKADTWLQEIIGDRPEGAYEGRDVYDHRGARLALHELIALRARVADLEAENRQQARVMQEQGAELRDAEREAMNAWYAAGDGAS